MPTKNGPIECWMDIQFGRYPKLTPLKPVVAIGEYITILVYLRTWKYEYDLRVRDCWAFNDPNFDSPSTGKIQLSNKDGCSR